MTVAEPRKITMKLTQRESIPESVATPRRLRNRPQFSSSETSDRETGKPPRRCILLLDDDPSVRRDLGELFRLAGFEVRSFATIRELLAYHRPDGPACLVLDIVLPDGDGLDLQKHLAEADPDLPVVLITGHMDDRLRKRALGCGAFAFLAKPPDWT